MMETFAAGFDVIEHDRRDASLGLPRLPIDEADALPAAPYGPNDVGHGIDPRDATHHELWRHYVEVPDHAATQSPAPAAGLPAGHTSNKLKIEIGHGSITGAITLTIEQGKTGVPLDDGQLKLFKDTLSMKANGFVAKLETAVLNDKLEDEILDGVKVVVDVSAMKVSSDGGADLLAIALKLQGDVGHWLGPDPNMKVTLDGSIQIGLGGKLGAKLARYTAAKLDREMLAKEAESVGHTIEQHANEARALERRIAELEADPAASRRAIGELKDELFAHKIQISTGRQQLEGLTHELALAEKKTKSLLARKIEGKLARSVAWAMEKKSVAFVVDKLAKLVPILNIASMVVDMVDIIRTIKQLVEHGFGDGGDSAEGERGGTGASRDPHESTGMGQGDGPVQKPEPVGSPAARRIIDAVTKHDHQGVSLDADQEKALSAMIPGDLTESEILEVIAHLKSDGAQAKTPEDAMGAIEGAVRRVRDRRRTVTVDGVSRPDLAHGEDDGPVTSPAQVEQGPADSSGSAEAAPASYDVATIVRQAPPSVIAQWFELKDGVLVASSRGLEWKARSRNATSGNDVLEDVSWSITERGSGQWDVELEFDLRSPQGGKKTRLHHFMVDQGTTSSTLGATTGSLVFEPYTQVQTGD